MNNFYWKSLLPDPIDSLHFCKDPSNSCCLALEESTKKVNWKAKSMSIIITIIQPKEKSQATISLPSAWVVLFLYFFIDFGRR